MKTGDIKENELLEQLCDKNEQKIHQVSRDYQLMGRKYP